MKIKNILILFITVVLLSGCFEKEKDEQKTAQEPDCNTLLSKEEKQECIDKKTGWHPIAHVPAKTY